MRGNIGYNAFQIKAKSAAPCLAASGQTGGVAIAGDDKR